MTRRPLPPYGRDVETMIARGERPTLLGGAMIAALDWAVALGWPRIVVPDDPDAYRYDFARGLDWIVVAPTDHQRGRADAVAQALRANGARCVIVISRNAAA